MKTKTLHFKSVSISRKRGDNAVAACAYRCGMNLYSEKEQKLHRYGNRDGVIETGFFLPESAPDWMKDDDQRCAWQRLGNEIEIKENSHNRRASAELFKDFQAAAPRELTHEQQWRLAQTFAKKLNDKGLIVAAALHENEASDGEKNPHFHFAVPLRTVDENGFGLKYRDLSGTWMVGKKNPELMALRRDYYQCVNDALADAGVKGVYYDPEKKEDQEPGIHLGKEASALERQGKDTRAAAHNRKVNFGNKLRPYDRALKETEEPWAFTPPASETEDWHKKFAEWQMLRTASMASRDAAQKSLSNVATPPATRSESRTEGARHGALLAHRQSMTYQERVNKSREQEPEMNR